MKQVLFAFFMASVAISSASADGAIADRYQKSCYACHAFGANNAPKTHVEADWAPRMEKGMDTLLAHVKNGFNTMPAKGLCFDCSDEEFKALIEFMAAPKP